MEPEYVPTGYLTLRQCVDRVARKIDPAGEDERWAAHAAYLEIAPAITEHIQVVSANNRATAPGLSKTNLMQISNLTDAQFLIIARHEAAETKSVPLRAQTGRFLRQMFGDGRIPTLCCRPSDGELVPIRIPLWRTDTAVAAFRSGKWPNRYGHKSDTGTVLVREFDLEAILCPPTVVVSETVGADADATSGHAVPRSTELAAWMRGYLYGVKQARGVVEKREAAINACREGTACTTREAEAAFEVAPFPGLRNAPPKERGRKVQRR